MPPSSDFDALDSSITKDEGKTPIGLEYLPIELIEHAFQYLELESYKSFRLVSRRCSFLGQPFILTPEMKLFPHRDDFTRLLEISQHSYFSSQIKRIKIYMAKADDYHFRNNMCLSQCVREGDGCAEMLRKSIIKYNKHKGLEEAFAENFCNPAILEQVFPNMKNLEAIDIKMEDCLYDDHLLWDAWEISSSRVQPGGTEIDHFVAILRAASRSSLRILTHDRLPFGIWDMDGYQPDLKTAFSKLTILKLVMECEDLNERINDAPECWTKKLSRCLKAASNLRELSIGFRLSFAAVLDCPLLNGLMLPHLHTLVLNKVAWQAGDLGDFLKAHGATLRRLRIWTFLNSKDLKGNNVRRTADLVALLKMMKENMKLEKLDVRGHPVIQYQPLEVFWFHETGIYDDDWRPVEEDKRSPTVVARRCEEYVIRNGPPLFEEELGDNIT